MADINIRGLAADSLVEMEASGTFLSTLETAVLDKYDYLDARDKAFYKRLLDGTTELRIRIDHILGLFSKTPVKKLKPYIRAVLRMSTYQILFMDSVPDSAACNEAVKLVTKHGLGGLKGFVNGVLRNISRNRTNIIYPDREKDPAGFMSVWYSCPLWLVDKLIKENGQETAELILKASLSEHPLSVRLRCGSEKAKYLEQEWRASGAEVRENPFLENARFIENAGTVSGLAGFAEGDITVQDTGSMLVAELAGIKAGDTVMDLCAAPGGKSIHAADILCKLESAVKGTGSHGHVYSYDISEERCERINENLSRLNVTNVSVESHDASVLIEELAGSADVVIVDAPCSGIGVMGHKSDIKYRISQEDVDSLHLLQRKILDTAVRYVRPGGRLIYSTCTVSREENDSQAEYIEKKLGMKPADMLMPRTGTQMKSLKLIPGRDASDGFFIAAFEK